MRANISSLKRSLATHKLKVVLLKVQCACKYPMLRDVRRLKFGHYIEKVGLCMSIRSISPSLILVVFVEDQTLLNFSPYFIYRRLECKQCV